MRHPTRRLERLYVVRLWREEGAPPRALRGCAEDLHGHRRVAFSDVRELQQFLVEALFQDDTSAS
ncbi:MAG TPA: hypothetical protein VJP76_08730 [Candidatus Tumulicola sp.]|nr:hypothetical protein [Candidatus Tumulicola sp.]